MTGMNATKASKRNEAGVAKWIWLHGPISRKSIASITGLNASTISYIVDRLIERGSVVEAGKAAARRGRKEVLLKFKPDHAYFVAVSLSRAAIDAAVTDLTGRILYRSSFQVELSANPEVLLEHLFSCIQEVLDELSDLQRQRLSSIAVGVPGPFTHSGNSVAVDPTDFPGLQGVPIVTLLSQRFELPVFLEERTNACSIAELTLGKGNEYPNFVYLNVGQGLGAGIVINRSLYLGGGHVAGEVGHMTINGEGPRCSCGNQGCWEQYASMRVLPSYLDENTRKSLEARSRETGGSISELTIEAALRGDPPAVNAVKALGRHLCVGLVNLIKSFDPDAIFIGDQGLAVFDLLKGEASVAIDRLHVHRYHDRDWLLPSTYGADGVLVGLAMIGVFTELERSWEESVDGASNPFAVQSLPDPERAFQFSFRRR